jgi:hypothetical protein
MRAPRQHRRPLVPTSTDYEEVGLDQSIEPGEEGGISRREPERDRLGRGRNAALQNMLNEDPRCVRVSDGSAPFGADGR